MLNKASLDAIAAARTHENLGRPLYNSYCFSQIPQAIAHCLTGDGDLGLPPDVLTGLPVTYQKVVFIFIDGFGWRFIKRYGEELPFLKRFFEHGMVSQLTTQFPSTTAVHTTTIHTGVPDDLYFKGIFKAFCGALHALQHRYIRLDVRSKPIK